MIRHSTTYRSIAGSPLIVFALALLASVLLILFVVAAQRADPDAGARTQTGPVQVSYAFDVADKRQLVGFGSNVFVGRVVAQAGTSGLPTSMPGRSVPYTQFSVAVEQNLKGSLDGTVTVSQQGGYAGDQLLLIAGDSLLIPGQTYLFVTRPVADKGWHQIVVPGYANVKIADVTQRATLVAEFARAVQEQIPFDPARRVATIVSHTTKLRLT